MKQKEIKEILSLPIAGADGQTVEDVILADNAVYNNLLESIEDRQLLAIEMEDRTIGVAPAIIALAENGYIPEFTGYGIYNPKHVPQQIKEYFLLSQLGGDKINKIYHEKVVPLYEYVFLQERKRDRRRRFLKEKNYLGFLLDFIG
jgi:hypothetical protein